MDAVKKASAAVHLEWIVFFLSCTPSQFINFIFLIFFSSPLSPPSTRRKILFYWSENFLPKRNGSQSDCWLSALSHPQLSAHLKAFVTVDSSRFCRFAFSAREALSNENRKKGKMDSSKAVFTKLSFRCFRSPICRAHPTVSASSNRCASMRHRTKSHFPQFTAQKIEKLFAFAVLAGL